MENIKSGVNIITKFCSSSSKEFKSYIDYIDRKEAIREESLEKYSLFNEYMEYMDDERKTSGLFTAQKDNLSSSEKKEMKEVFQKAQKNKSLLWQTVISFDNRWLEEMGLYDSQGKILDEKRIISSARASMGELLEKENMNNAVYTGAIHYNTDNIHVHIATVEPFPQREKEEYTQYEMLKINDKWQCRKEYDKELKRYVKIPKRDINGNIIKKMEYRGKFKESNIKKAKSMVVKELTFNKDLNMEINNILRNEILDSKKEDNLIFDKNFKKELKMLFEKLPRHVNRNLWTYNSSIMKPLKGDIDKIVKKYIEKYHSENFKDLEVKLEAQEKVYKTAYGGKENNFKENKIKDLYARLGNSILNELKEYDRYKVFTERKKDYAKDKRTYDKQKLALAVRQSERRFHSAIYYLHRSLKKDYEKWRNIQDYELLQAKIAKETSVECDR